jgi:pimeloyl-ACP methyl ester carboxylesterase
VFSVTMSNNKFIFFHGGPGFNSRGEERLLAPAFRQKSWEILFWNQIPPSNKDRAFTELLNQVHGTIETQVQKTGPVRAIAHSFAAHPLLRLAARHPEYFLDLTLIGPTLDLFDLCKNILGLASKDFHALKESGREKEVQQALRETQRLFDPAMRAGFKHVVEDSLLLGHYFSNQKVCESFVQVWADLGLSIDEISFFSVMDELAAMTDYKDGLTEIRVPTRVLWTLRDPVVLRANQEPVMKKIAPHAKAHVFEESGHYPHLEQTDLFMKLLETKA